jgi:serine/threonine-protein kinase RsbW
VVEDDAATRATLALVLEADGCRVVEAANGREGLDRLRQEPPDLIVLDLAMPVLDGWQFRCQQQQNPDLAPIPVVVLSAEGDLLRRAGSLGAAALLEKPVELDQLLDAVRPLLGGPHPGAASAGTAEGSGRPCLESARPRPLIPDSAGPVALALRLPEEVVPALDRVSAALSAAGYPERDAFALRLALEEALVNALKHGHRCDPSKEVRLRYRVTAEEAVAEVEDQGPGFDPAAVPDPLAPENLEKPSGRGLLLMRRYLSWLRFNERGNVVTLCRRRSGP